MEGMKMEKCRIIVTDDSKELVQTMKNFFDEQKDKAETGKVDLQSRIQMVAFPKKLRTIQRVLCQSFSGYYLDNDS